MEATAHRLFTGQLHMMIFHSYLKNYQRACIVFAWLLFLFKHIRIYMYLHSYRMGFWSIKSRDGIWVVVLFYHIWPRRILINDMFFFHYIQTATRGWRKSCGFSEIFLAWSFCWGKFNFDLFCLDRNGSNTKKTQRISQKDQVGSTSQNSLNQTSKHRDSKRQT